MFRKLLHSLIGTAPERPAPATPSAGEAPDAPQTSAPDNPFEIALEFTDPPADEGVWYVLSSRRHRIYIVDLNQRSCNCSQFTSKKLSMPGKQVQKYCTHMFHQARRLGFCRTPRPKHELVQGYFDHLEHSGYAIGDKFFLRTIEQNDVLVVQKLGTSWVDVLTRKNRAKDAEICTGDINRYGYNAPANRWSYGDAPFHPLQIKTFMRTLPVFSDTTHHESEVDRTFPLHDFLRLNPSIGIADEWLVDEVFQHLREITDVGLIKSVLEKLQNFDNVTSRKLASEWYEHGRNLLHQGNDEFRHFFHVANGIDPKLSNMIEEDLASAPERQSNDHQRQDGFRSVSETKVIEQKQKRVRLARIGKNLICISSEELQFNELRDTKRKREADKLFKGKTPKWNRHGDGNTFRGYLYADFVREFFPLKRLEKLSEEDASVVDYIASRAILDGTISDRTMATMHRTKGHLALSRGEPALALRFFHQALSYYPNVGVKKLARELEFEAGL